MGSNNGGNLGGFLEKLSCGLQLRRAWRCRNEGPPGKGLEVPTEFGGLC